MTMPAGCGDYELWSRRLEKLLRCTASGGLGFGGGETWSPPTDVFETAEGVVVKMELPGVSRDELEVVLVGNRLVVKGRRVDADAGRKIRYHQMEIAFGSFVKVVNIRMPYEREGIRAHLADGYLELFIPTAKEQVPELIVVEIKL